MAKVEITLNDLFNLHSAVIYNPDEFKSSSNIVIDSREVVKGAIFFAIEGEKFDGHDFVNDAEANGASALIINEKKLNKFDSVDATIITVPDTTEAYGELASMWRKKLNAKVISISGSNGKTTTKDILAVILSEKFNVVKTIANNNNHIGVPLTIFSADQKCEILILEHGTNHFGEIAYTANIAKPDYVLLTNIGDSHLEFLIDRKGVYKEKSALFNQHKNLLFVNNDDKILSRKSAGIKNKISFGFSKTSDVTGKVSSIDEVGRTLLSVKSSKKNIECVLPLIGEANANNFLAAITVAIKMGLTKKQIVEGIAKVKPPKQRLNLIELPNAVLIDDTYNSNPDSMKNAVELLNKISRYDRKILVIGDMFELGETSEQKHRELSALILKNKIDEVYMIGKLMKKLNDELAGKKIKIGYNLKRSAFIKSLEKNNFSNAVILVKGSRGMKMEEFRDVIIKGAS